MDKSHSILKNSSFLTAGDFFRRCISVYVGILIARYLGPEYYGQYTYIIAFVTIAAIFWDLGLNTVVTRDLSRDKTVVADYTGSAMIIKSILLLLVLFFITLYHVVLRYSSVIVASIFIFSLSTFCLSIRQVFNGVFTAYRRMEFPAIFNVLQSIILLLTIIVVSERLNSVVALFLCYLVSSLITTIFCYITLRHYFTTPSFRIDFRFFWSFAQSSFPFMSTSLVSIALFKIDHLMLSWMRGDAELGLYGAVYSIFEVVIALFPLMLISSSFPVLANLYVKNLGAMSQLVNVLIKYFILIAIPISCGIVLLGSDIVNAVYGENYASAGRLMSILGGAIWIFFLTTVVSWSLTAMDCQKMVLISNVFALVLNVILNILLVGRYGAVATASNTLVCELAQLVFMYGVLRNRLPIRLVLHTYKPLVASAGMAVVILVTKQFLVSSSSLLNLGFTVCVSFIIFCALALLMKAFDVDEIRMLMSS